MGDQMVMYVREIHEGINITSSVITKVTRNPQVTIALVWLMIFIAVFFSLIFVLQKLLECWVEKKKREIKKRYLFVLISLLFLLFVLISIAIHYPSINLLKPISDWFGIPYR